MPCSTLPVTTVPRPEMVNTSSIGIRNGLSVSRTGSGTKSSTACMSSRIFSSHSLSPSRAFRAETRTTGVSSPGNSYSLSSSRTSSSTRSSSSSSSTMSALLRATTIDGHADLAGQQHVLPGLRHGAVGRRHDQDGAVDLGRAGDHVFDVVGVAGHVDVGVVPVGRLVLDVGDVDRDAPLLLLGRLVDLVERLELGAARVALGQDLGDRRGQGGLAVVDVTHRPDVEMGLVALELLLGHGRGCSSCESGRPAGV